MQHTLPLKQKQIEQTRLEAEARKEATLKNAEAAAQAKVIDSQGGGGEEPPDGRTRTRTVRASPPRPTPSACGRRRRC